MSKSREEIDAIVRAHLPLAATMVERYRLTRPPILTHEDEMAAAVAGLAKGAAEHDPDRAALSTILGHNARWAILGQRQQLGYCTLRKSTRNDRLRSRSRFQMKRSLDTRTGRSQTSLAERLPGTQGTVLDLLVEREGEAEGLVDRLLARCDPADRRLLKERYLEGKLLRDLARERGVSKEAVRQRILRAFEALREVATELGLDQI